MRERYGQKAAHKAIHSLCACKFSECLSEDELAQLSADLVVLSNIPANILL